MAAQQHLAFGMDEPTPTTSPPPEALRRGRPTAVTEPPWLWESVRYQFWRAADLDYSIRHVGPFTPEQGEAIAYWWSLLAAVDGLGPRAYAAAFVRATEQRDSDQVRWSLLALLRDELQHEQLCRMVLQHLIPNWPIHDPPPTDLGRHLRGVYEQAEQCWFGCRRALDHHGIGVVEGGLLLMELVTGALYEGWATTCTLPTFTTAFRHAARDAQRHQAVLRALIARDWPLLSATERSDAAARVQAAASFLSTVMLARSSRQPEPSVELQARDAGFGVPTAEQRQELLRAALLKVKDLQKRYGIPFPAMPELAIAGSERSTAWREA
jgi:hypothetical protein